MRLEVDTNAGAAYIYLTDQSGGAMMAAKTLEVHALLDLDEDGNVIGVEIIEWPTQRQGER